MSLEFGLVRTGPCTVMHHQHYQMVDLLMQHCRKTMGGLNPNALPYAPLKQQNAKKESSYKQKNNNKKAEPSKWHICKEKKGCIYKNNNKNKKEKENKIF